MATFVRMPQKGLTEESAILTKWYVKEGLSVKEGQYLFALETGKATFDVEAESSGIVLKLLAAEGDEVLIKKIVCVIGSEGEAFVLPDEGDAAAPAAADSVSQQRQGPGTAPTSVPPAAPAAIGPEFFPETPAAQSAAAEPHGPVKISPRARRLARTRGLAYSLISGTGPGGRIIEDDIKAALSSQPASFSHPAAPASFAPASVTAGEYTAVPNDRVRKTIALAMHRSLQSMAQFTMFAHFDASELLAYRERCNLSAPPEAKLTINDFAAFAVSRVLLDFPRLNAHFFDDKTLLFTHVNLGIAVDTPRGLLVPTVRNADTKSLSAISREIKTLAALCREGKAAPQDLADGTFTISNIGAYNVDYFTPIINPPQTAILGIGALDYKRKKTPAGMADYPAMSLSLTVDHRAVDGAPGAAFLKALCEELENFPLLLAK
ncbi:MAG: 2-oxo acid dehydrogenase subunit E2 [Spirochaetales bacterium]|jgi:pyruvate dehydrogenase E2 component (dihydrolipoamide acetyltransferase)|nr:2-oxo acid dehydrogenase subunit E2 [Spirochaetales bacterium]